MSSLCPVCLSRLCEPADHANAVRAEAVRWLALRWEGNAAPALQSDEVVLRNQPGLVKLADELLGYLAKAAQPRAADNQPPF
jgi:hypothetical protein